MQLSLTECLFFLYFAEVFDLKMKYDESDNLIVRATRTFTDKIGSMFGKYIAIYSLPSPSVFLVSNLCEEHIIFDIFQLHHPICQLHIVLCYDLMIQSKSRISMGFT